MNQPFPEWHDKKNRAFAGGGSQKVAQQHESHKKTARERIALLVDPDSFEELDQLATSPFLNEPLYSDGVITGFGTVQGKQVAVYAQDFTIRGGSVGKQHAFKICKIMDLAAKVGCPIIGLVDSGGARIEEGIHALAGFGDIFLRNTRYSGVVPQITLILGPCAGGAVYSPALTDFIFTVKGISQLFITGPQVIAEVLHQTITKDELGGALIHASKSGVAHLVSDTEEDCFNKLKQLLTYLPSNYLDHKSTHHHQTAHETFQPSILVDSLNEELALLPDQIVPHESNKAFDIKKLIHTLVDHESFFEIQELFAPNIVIGLARIDHKVVGIVANQPMAKAGTLDIDASCKAARFIVFCDNFSIPIVSLVDIPGFLPGIDQEHNGIIRHGAKLLYAYANATVPKITVILRKAFGGAYIVMGSKHLGADFVFSWPEAEIAVMGAAGAVTILQGKALKTIEDKDKRALRQKELEADYKQEFLNPFVAAQWGYIDAIIEPNETRKHLIRALNITHDKVEHLPKRKKGNIPL